MILTGDEIQQRIDSDLQIDPFDPKKLNPNGYSLTLHDQLLVYEEVVLDLKNPNRYRRFPIPCHGIVLQPDQLYLGRTVERIESQNLVPTICGRRSLSRLGMFVNGSSAGEVGYSGHWTLEIHVIQPIRIYPWIDVCQVFFHEVCGPLSPHSGDPYQTGCDIQPSQMYRELGGGDSERQLELNFEKLARQAT